MAVVTTKSSQITNRDASPKVLSNSRIVKANVQHARGVVTAVNGDSATSKYVFCSIPSNAVPVSLRYSAPDIGTTTAMDVGLYRTTQDGGAVVDVDFFATAVALNAGPYSKVEIVNEAGTIATPANSEQPIWQLLGLSADPCVTYDIVGTLTGAADGGGAILLEADYTL